MKEQARVADQNNRDQLQAISGLAEEIRGMAAAITSAITQTQSGPYDSKPVSNSPSTGMQIGLLTGMAAIVFGLMAPMYIMVQSVRDQATNMDARMAVDDIREREDAASFADHGASLQKMIERIEVIRRDNGRINQAIMDQAKSSSAKGARIKYLEEEVNRLRAKSDSTSN
jgi:uncharacterized protein (UPF0335 family)